MQEFTAGDFESLAHLFNGLVEQSVAGIYLIQNGEMRYVNQRFAEFFGTTPDRFVGRTLRSVVPEHQRDEMVALYERRLEGADPEVRYNIHTSTPDADERVIQIHGRRVNYRGSPAVVGIGIDVTAQEISRRQLVGSRAEVRKLAEALETIQDRERAQIALEIHDDIGGLLTAMKFDISRLRKRLDSSVLTDGDTEAMPDLRDLVSGLSGLTQETIDVARRISEVLRSPLVDHFGLAAAVSDYVERFSARYGIDCSYEFSDELSEVSSDDELDLFRIIQEALNNVARHSRASAVCIRLHRDSNTLVLTIEDDGRGIKTVQAEEAERKYSGIGLIGMNERARRIGGRIEIGEVATGGTSVRVTAPWSFCPRTTDISR